MKHKKIRKILVLSAAVLLLGLASFALYGKYKISKIPELSFEDALTFTTKNSKEAVITVGIIKDGISSYTVYGKNGTLLPEEEHTYEIGSLTKTFTAALICRAIQDGKISLDDTIDSILFPSADSFAADSSKAYPTILQLLTHTAGYKAYYFERPMISNFFSGRNDFYKITGSMVLEEAKKHDITKDAYDFTYSNFGYAVLGLVLEELYQQNYSDLMNTFLQQDLYLMDTKLSDKTGDLYHYWDWAEKDAYQSAGAITSNITDMLSYAQMQLSGDPLFAQCQESLVQINASTASYQQMGINMDEIGMAWIIDRENNFIWHNGGTDNYNCYLGFCPSTRTAVVILSNLPPNKKIPATILGVKLLQSLQE